MAKVATTMVPPSFQIDDNLTTEQGLTAFNSFIETKSYVEGYQYSEKDLEYFIKFQSKIPNAKTYPHASRWYHHISTLTAKRGVFLPPTSTSESASESVPIQSTSTTTTKATKTSGGGDSAAAAAAKGEAPKSSGGGGSGAAGTAGGGAAPKGTAKRDALLANEVTIQKEWEESGAFEANPSFDDGKESFMVTFPYPYSNGHLHIGHAFSLTKAIFRAQFERHQGKNVLFPFAFHCTGMPIQAVSIINNIIIIIRLCCCCCCYSLGLKTKNKNKKTSSHNLYIGGQ